ncbi:helix-turn-helix domain-containing protein [Sphingomicrobium lutaoense]|uniref:Excisionase family DNA binding protein n=1 Tax=Sphingomicrobium lutaoense TaxID=515949 RepID=A0A839Z7Z6_9SPHN|nr:helix-turn-helix domain-containing protein [Sphingomicrobium lutaoense]MBB3765044.1 excisionase family DNA binding protein [Sphingomicrobium lutaoense]
MTHPELMTMSEFLARYSIGRTTAYREVAAGRLKIRKLGSATRIAREDADAWMASLPVRGGEAA